VSLKIVSIPCSQGICFRCEVDECECSCHTVRPGMTTNWLGLWVTLSWAVGSAMVIGAVVVVVIKILGGD
jgi:hypothetical protein